MANYCNVNAVSKLSLADPMCYNYMGGYASAYGMNDDIQNAVSGYCAAQYPNGTLDAFNEGCSLPGDDCNICACNLDQSNYQTYTDSLSDQIVILDSDAPQNCFLPACAASDYREKACPTDQCLSNVTVTATNAVQPGVVVGNTGDCPQLVRYGPTGGPTAGPTGGSSGGSSGEPTGGSGGGSSGEPTGGSGGGSSGEPTGGSGGGSSGTTSPALPTALTPAQQAAALAAVQEKKNANADSSAWIWLVVIIFVVIAIVVVVIAVVAYRKRSKEATMIADPMLSADAITAY